MPKIIVKHFMFDVVCIYGSFGHCMTVRELKEALEDFPEEAVVYTDWDREGDNENEATEVALFHPGWISYDGRPPGVKIGS